MIQDVNKQKINPHLIGLVNKEPMMRHTFIGGYGVQRYEIFDYNNRRFILDRKNYDKLIEVIGEHVDYK